MAVVVNGQRIEQAEIEAEVEQLRPHYEQYVDGQGEAGQLEQWARENLIERALVEQAARALEVEIPAERIDAAYEQVRERAGDIPAEQVKADIELQMRIERLMSEGVGEVPEPTDEQLRTLHKTIKAVSVDLDNMEFNTAIARMMEFVNVFTRQKVRPKSVMSPFVLLLSPYAPHIAEELWQLLGHDETLAYEPWPQYDEALARDTTIEVPVQILGKVRSRVSVPADATKDDLEAAAKSDERIAELLAVQQVVKTIVVPGRLVNFVVK